LIESFHSFNQTEKIFTNSLTEIFVDDGAKLENYILQEEGILSYRNDMRLITSGKGTYINNVNISLDGGLARNDTHVSIEGEGSESHLNGLFIAKANRHIDNHTLVEHRVPNCMSNELYKGIISDDGTGVFNGKILVYKDAQKTNAYQSNKNILLGDKATVYTKPQLEIYADDVKCSHGSSTGRMDEEALFYLRSRGLDENTAKKLMLQAFALEVSNTIKNDTFREYVQGKIDSSFL
jgi:Fe-S cluster assembly protein SufD